MPDLSYEEFLRAEAESEARRRRPARLLPLFVVAFLALHYAWEASRGTALERFVIHDLTVQPAAWIIDTLWPGSGVRPQGHRLVAPAGRLNILNGCEGLETLFLLLAAFAAYPFPWRARLPGMAMGVGLVYVLNQTRIVLLWQTFTHDKTLFGILHGTVLPLAMVAGCLAFFLVFLSRHEPQPA
ncbi:MAG: exosortase/archaeosortase family protein [Gallionellaceae bacterium]|nr:exosortase/archaeosortase family protein [Gallionellaceae bacterium]MDD5365517.1 exosortase/archaeosortase family protein [Gallionellaceae bacterium]